MNKLSAATVLLCGVCSCTNREQQYEPDMQFIRDLGYEYAAEYRALKDKGHSEMERQDFLLDVNARQAMIAVEASTELANEFRRAFADSAFVDEHR